jgi:signal transduction histidine kinase/ActR/RegA family two-component response regulator
MDAQLKTTSTLSKSNSERQSEHIQAELIHLIYKQFHIGLIISGISAAALTFLIWHQVPRKIVYAWLAGFMLINGLHTLLVRQYHHHKVPSHKSKRWGHFNLMGLAMTGFLWGATMVVLFPSGSLAHQLCIALLLCGLIAAFNNLYAVVPGAVAACSLPIFAAWIIRFLTYGDPLHMVIAAMAILYMVITISSSQRIAKARRQLLMTRYTLANRVSKRSRALKKTNADLQTEIRERQKITERLRQERDRLEIITTTIGAGLAVISKKYRILWSNRIFETTFGKNIGALCHQTQYQRDTACQECGARMVFEQGVEKVVHERKSKGPDGKPAWYQITTTPIRNSRGHIQAALELVLPITELKETEASQLRMTEKLEEARKTEAIATLAGGIAHQFNNALAVIAGYVELLEYDYQKDLQINTYTNPILKASKKMSELTSQLLAYAKGGKYKEHPTELSDVVEAALSFIKHTLPKTITLEMTRQPELPKVKIDTTQIQMVVTSIVSNAVEAIEHNGHIHILCKSIIVDADNQSKYHDIPAGRYVSLVTADDGVGMNKKTIERIFEPFFTTKFEGRGLGMAAVYGIIKNHSGHIHVTSQQKVGTEVCIYLPALEDIIESLDDANDQPVQGSGTILVVEDNVAIIDVNQTWLKRIGYHVVIATTAHEAMEIICRTNVEFDVVLLDMVLPDMDGAALFPEIQKHRPDAKVIVCSGCGQDGAIQELLDAGADGFLQKPFTLSQLSKKINQVLPPDDSPHNCID